MSLFSESVSNKRLDECVGLFSSIDSSCQQLLSDGSSLRAANYLSPGGNASPVVITLF
jgi:hypothetical protein